jgi:hypothetical protein
MNKYLAYFFALLLFLYLFTAATAQTTRTHSCYNVDDARLLAEHLATKEWVGYDSLFNELEAEGRCYKAVVPTPSPYPPLHMHESRTMQVGVFLTMTQNRVSYTLMLGRYTRNSGA